MIRKRGMLLGNLTNIIIAVLGIIVFGFFVYKVYTLYSSQEETNAKNTIEFLSGKLKSLEDGQNNTFLVQGFEGGDNWALAGWGKNEGEESGKPDKCFGKSCVCICKPGRSECQLAGFCEFIDVNEIEVRTALTSPDTIIGMNGELAHSSSEREGIQMTNNIIGIYAEKKEGRLIVEANGGEGTTVRLTRPYTGV